MKDFSFEGFNGLARQYPVVAFTATIFLLSLAGIPLTGGFLAKYYMVAAVMQTGSYLMAGDFRPALRHSKCILLFPGDPGHVFQGRRPPKPSKSAGFLRAC